MDLSTLQYDLPEDRIAKHPLLARDESRLLVSRPDSAIELSQFKDLLKFIPKNAVVIRNNAKVIPARLPFKKATGGEIEIFCLTPVEPSNDPQLALGSKARCVWNCLIGGKKISHGQTFTLTLDGETLIAHTRTKEGAEAVVEFTWGNGRMFSEWLELGGQIPIPPYLKRESEDADKVRYQTVYSKISGSVAAPTAGLHFTPRLEAELDAAGIPIVDVTLHVGAGTFRPVETQDLTQHPMHTERFGVGLATLEQLHALSNRPWIVVGTTTLRVLESLAWLSEQNATEQFAWQAGEAPSRKAVLESLLARLRASGSTELTGETRIMIMQGYPFKMVDGLVTNFHQPGSTLLALVDAWIGTERRREVYETALKKNLRFLSFGDCSLLFR